MEADTNTGEGDISQKPIELQNDLERSQNAFESLLAGPAEDNQTEDGDEALQDSDEAEEIEAAEEDFGEDDDYDEELSADEDDDVELDEEPSEELFAVNIDGETVEVTREELIKGYSRQSDYTRKTQSLAEERKQFDEEAQAVRQERANYATLLDRLEQQLQSGVTPEEQAQLEALRQTDPMQYMLAKEEIDAREQKLSAIQQERQRVAEQQEADRQRELKGHIEKERKALFEAIPEWSDAKVAEKEQTQIRDYAMSMGFSQEELSQMFDSRAFLVFRDAMRAKQATTNKPRERVKKVAKAGAKRVRRSQKRVAMERLQKSGSNRDATAVFENLLSGKG